MKQSTITIVTFFVLVILIGILYTFTGWFSSYTGYVFGEDEKVKLAQCLTGGGAEFYTSPTCPSCVKQLELFGDTANKFLTVVECLSIDSCEARGGVPAWKINGKFYYEIRELIDLSEVSGCQVDLEE